MFSCLEGKSVDIGCQISINEEGWICAIEEKLETDICEKTIAKIPKGGKKS